MTCLRAKKAKMTTCIHKYTGNRRFRRIFPVNEPLVCQVAVINLCPVIPVFKWIPLFELILVMPIKLDSCTLTCIVFARLGGGGVVGGSACA